jgi:hypothetical protein
MGAEAGPGAVAQTEIVYVQNLFNLADQRSLDVLTECQARNIAFVPSTLRVGPVRCGTSCSPIPSSPRWGHGWGHGWAQRPVQVALAWLLDLAGMCCIFRELGHGLISPRTSPAPTSSLTTSPGRSFPALSRNLRASTHERRVLRVMRWSPNGSRAGALVIRLSRSGMRITGIRWQPLTVTAATAA